MINRILVPTDGSPLSERAVFLADTVAHAQGAEVLFVQVVELPHWVNTEPEGYISPEVYDDLISALDEDATRNMEALVERCRQRGLKAASDLRHGSPSSELLDAEVEHRPDLVVMGSHGRTGLARFALGSVADRLVRDGLAPVLVVKSFGPEAASLERALVPLDGSPVAEEALKVVMSLNGKPLRSVVLLRAIGSADERTAAASYLEQVSARLTAAGLQIEIDVRTDEPATAIDAAAAAADFVIMATHGPGGFDRLRHGSVAEEASRHLTQPVLLVRAGTAQTSNGGRPTDRGRA